MLLLTWTRWSLGPRDFANIKAVSTKVHLHDALLNKFPAPLRTRKAMLFYAIPRTVSPRVRCTLNRQASSAFSKVLLKKFMFQVHPDYFHNYKAIQAINATNLSALQTLLDQGSSTVSSASDAKSLTFYLKPELFDSKPQKVKVSTIRIEKSILEILETIGVEVPAVAEERESILRGTQSTVLASAAQTLEFLQSMLERRPLIQLREHRISELRRLEKELLGLTGASAVCYRNSWSAHNNAILLSKLHALITQHQQTLELPWTNMSIVFSKDGDEQRISYLDREIVLTSSDVPEQLLGVLGAIRVGAIFESQAHVDQIQQLQARFETAATSILHGTMQDLTATQQASESRVGDMTVRVRRGFTCGMTNFYYFLYQMNKGKWVIDNQNVPALDGDRIVQEQTGGALRPPPLCVSITIEDSHGTKILEDGSFRIDVRAETEDVYALLQTGARGLGELASQHQQMQLDIEILRKEVTATLGITSLQTAVGISPEQLLTFLQRVDAYLRMDTAREALLQLNGLRLVVGQYLGVADDGACILPWEVVLPED